MENYGGLIGVAVAIGLTAYFRNKNPAGTKLSKFLQLMAIIAVAAVAGAAVSIGGKYLRMSSGTPSKGDVDRAMSTLRSTPMVGLVMSEHPHLEAEFRAAIERQMKNPPKGDGPSELSKMGADLRQRYIVPAVRNTDDASAIRAVEAFQKLIVHLQTVNVPVCREMGTIGIQNPDKLDTQGKALFEASLAAQESAYRVGQKAPTRVQPTDEEFVTLLRQAGFTDRDFEEMSNFDTLPVAAACSVTVKLWLAPNRLSAQRRAVLARFLLMM